MPVAHHHSFPPIVLPPDFFSPADLAVAPIERAETIPSNWYTDPAMYPLDRQWIIARTWQYIGPASRVERPGQFVTATVAGNPVIVVRGKDEQLRGFFNVCRHRGGPLAIDETGSCNALQCKYHGWTYRLDGTLRGVPQFDRVELFDRRDFGLIHVAVEVWQGMLFAKLLPADSTDIMPDSVPDIMAGIIDRIAPMMLTTKQFVARVTYEVPCNWKVYLDNYLEGYHLPYVHPELCNLLDFQHYVTETHPHYSLQFSPFTGKDNVYDTPDGHAFYYFIYPNFMLNILPGRMQTNVVIPVAHNQTKVVFDYFYDAADTPAVRKMAEDDMQYSDRVQREDMEICQHVQAGLESIAYHKGRFSVQMEQAVYHFQSQLKQSYRAGIRRNST